MLDTPTTGLAERREIPEIPMLPLVENVVYCPELSVQSRRNTLAAWLGLEADVVQVTTPGTEERRRVRVVTIASGRTITSTSPPPGESPGCSGIRPCR